MAAACAASARLRRADRARAGCRGVGRRRHGHREGRKPLAGCQAPVLGDAGQDRQLPGDRVGARSASVARSRSGGRCICPRSGARMCRVGARPRFPTRSSCKPSRGSRPRSASRRQGGRSSAGRCWATAPTATTRRFRTGLHGLGLEYVLAVSAQIGVFGPETTFAVPERTPGRGQPPSVARPDRNSESVVRWPSGCPPRPGRPCPAAPRLPARSSMAASRSWRGFHHCALVTCAHAFLTLERICPKARRPA
jgi:hypothetical protein